MHVYCGVDIVNVPRFKESVSNHGNPDLSNAFINRIFNKEEIEHIIGRENPYPGLAGRFAAKEAVIKAASHVKKISELKSISVIGNIPKVNISDPEFKDVQFAVSISHDGDYAIAMVTAQII
ncbi:MAG: 4'-phosphopantetheinyl transferase superfamily protein [bacterium]